MNKFLRYCQEQVDIAPLASLRFIFGVVVTASLIRFYLKGWLYTLYIQPSFHFKYWGFEWVTVPSEQILYLLFFTTLICAVFMALGLLYRLTSILFFLGFTYIELLDKSTYLNHYYFVSLISFLLIWVPANAKYSIDCLLFKRIHSNTAPRWCIDILKLQMAILYFFAGIAKLNSDWLFHAQPLKIWLRGKEHIPVIGWIAKYAITPYIFAWSGMLYDLLVSFFLWNKRTRALAYIGVIGFHALTAIFFPGIGMFPYIMMGITLIFFSPNFHKAYLNQLFRIHVFALPKTIKRRSFPLYIIAIHFVIQLVLPFRYLAYPGNLFWNEEGFRYSWRVMLIEKAGYALFKIYDPEIDRYLEVNNRDFLTITQEKMMSTQPDMIVEYAHHLRDYYNNYYQKDDLEVYADVFVTLNGRKSQRFIDQHVNLAAQKDELAHKTWILPLEE